MDAEIRNVLLYVDDAVRDDALGEGLAALGPTYKTVAASTHTPTSFGSLLTGLYPPESGILSFEHTVPGRTTSIFDLETHDVTLAAEGGMNHSLAAVFDDPPRASIEDVTEPFVHVVRRPGGHAPYDGFDWDSYEYQDETAVEYLHRISGDPSRARDDYARGVERSFEEFESVLSHLEERDLLKETLVVYTSDHGELLGEYGFFGHTHLATPEVVYVPTTFIHPTLEPGRRDQLLHHVDILPTLAASIEADVDFGVMRGRPFGGDRKQGYNHFEHVHYGDIPDSLEDIVQRTETFDRTIRSLWDVDGGRVFVEGSLVPAALVYLVLLTKSPIGRQLIHNRGFTGLFKRFIPGRQSYGSPSFDHRDARKRIENLLKNRTGPVRRELDAETKDRLHDMGYI